jgi:thioredoxin reductase
MYDTIIIGAGICGLTDFGGQFMVSGEVLNYPGIVKTSGIELNSKMEEQMKFNGVKVKLETVKEIKKSGKNFKVISDKGKYDTKSVIIATGSKPRKLNVPGEDKFANKGVTYCSICDGPLFSGMDVAVVGAGASALEAVDFLKDIATKIYLIVRGDKFTGHEYLIERVKKNPKVKVLFNADTKEILGNNMVTGLKYEQNGEGKTINVKGVIIEIGRVPNTEPFRSIVELDEHKHIKIDCQQHTNVDGILAAGDCASGHEYQYVISAGQGCMALIKAARYLASRKE